VKRQHPARNRSAEENKRTLHAPLRSPPTLCLALLHTNERAADNPLVGSFPSLNPVLALKFAYSVSFALPAALAGGPLTLFLDLFDNLNAAASLAYVQGVRIESAAPAAVKLHSAAAIRRIVRGGAGRSVG